MKHLKLFSNNDKMKLYQSTNWITPHVFKYNDTKLLDYEEKYTPIEYISSTKTGGQYIDLKCHLFENSDDIRIDIKFNMKGGGKDYDDSTGVNKTKPSVLIGCISEADPYYGFVVRKADVGSLGTANDNYVTMYTKWQISNSVYKNANGDANSKQKYYPTYLAGDISEYEQTPLGQIYEKTLIIDNISSCTTTQLNKMKTLESYMFAIYNDGTASGNIWNNKIWRYAEADIYYCRITKGNTIIRDLIPVLNKNNNPGLYDRHNKVFFGSLGDNPFVAGPLLT